MSVARPERPPTQLELAKQHVEHALGEKVAKRLETFEDGGFYIRAGAWAGLLSWFVDFLVFVFGVVAGFVTAAVATRNSEVSDNVVMLIVLGLLVATPFVYGLFFGDGRGLGGVLTGTRLVRAKNGRRLGASASWAVMVRIVLFPLLVGAAIMGGAFGGSLKRISIDDAATGRLHAAGFQRL